MNTPDRDPSNSEDPINPFAPPKPMDSSVVPPPVGPASGEKFSGLGAVYWLSLAAVAGLFVVIGLASGYALSAFGLSSSFFAMVYGIMYHARLSQRFLAGQSVGEISELAVLIGSLLLGALGTVAAAIVFVATCVPTALMIDSMRAPYGIDDSIYIISGICGIVAVFAVGLLLRLVLPRKPRNM